MKSSGIEIARREEGDFCTPRSARLASVSGICELVRVPLPFFYPEHGLLIAHVSTSMPLFCRLFNENHTPLSIVCKHPSAIVMLSSSHPEGRPYGGIIIIVVTHMYNYRTNRRTTNKAHMLCLMLIPNMLFVLCSSVLCALCGDTISPELLWSHLGNVTCCSQEHKTWLKQARQRQIVSFV